MKPILVLTLAIAIATGCKRDTQPASSAVATPAASIAAKPAPAASATATQWKTVEEFSYAWKSGQAPVRFRLELPEGYGDPGDFTRIRIQVNGQPEFVLDNEDGWIEHNSRQQESKVYAKLKAGNLVQSKYALILPSSSRKGEAPLVFLRSWSYASDAERLHVIGFKPSGEPITLFNDDLDLEKFEDLDGDGYREIVGWPCLSQSWGPGLVTYDPHHVYKIPHPITAPAQLSLELSKAYNLKNYYGWAGPECSEELAVVLHPPNGGKPAIMNAKEAEKLMEQAGEKKK